MIDFFSFMSNLSSLELSIFLFGIIIGFCVGIYFDNRFVAKSTMLKKIIDISQEKNQKINNLNEKIINITNEKNQDFNNLNQEIKQKMSEFQKQTILYEKEILSLQLQVERYKTALQTIQQQNKLTLESQKLYYQTHIHGLSRETMQEMHCVPNNQKPYTFFLATENNKKFLRCENLINTTCRILEKECIKLNLCN